MNQCPWDELRKAYGPPNIDWCEASLCAWITEPANTWSNLAYVVVAALLWRGPTRRFAQVVLAVGTLSFVYHASNTFVLQVFDFLGMFLLLGLPFATNLRRLLITDRTATAYWLFVAAMMGALFALRALGWRYQVLVLVSIIAVLASEAFVTRAGPRRPLLIGVALLAAAFAFSIVDATRLWCHPDDHLLQGHALWHVLSAAAQLGLARYYST